MPRHRFIVGDVLMQLRHRLSPNSVDLIFGSPPYAEKGERYDRGPSNAWPTRDWVRWMVEVTEAAVHVSRGFVIWVVNGSIWKKRYLPACEGLVWSCFQNPLITCERPVIWHKNAPPVVRNWFINEWEYVLAFHRADVEDPYFDWQSVAQPPKYTTGGHFNQRNRKGKRIRGGYYPSNKLARPRDVLRVTVGGGHLGHKLAHENEAPFPLKLAEHFVRCCCPKNGTVLDPFCGSGTTTHAAHVHNRKSIAIDIRAAQVSMAKRRLRDVQCSA